MSLEWWQKHVIYHVYLPSFKDSDADGYGDFAGLASKLDYLEDCNLKVLLLSPFYPSPMKDNGYDISSFVEIDPKYGSMDEFEHFIKESNKRGMNVLIDLVANHTSNQHEWFQRSLRMEDPYTDYYVWNNKKKGASGSEPVPPNNWLSIFGGSAWAWSDERQQFYYHQFLEEQPDLNLRNPLVVEEIKKVMAFWLDKGVSGFRIDAASHLFEDAQFLDEPLCITSSDSKDEYSQLSHIYTKGMPENHTFLKELRTVLDEFEKKTGKSKIMVVEAMENLKKNMEYYGTIHRKIADFPFNFSFYTLEPTSSGTELFELIDSWLRNMPKGKCPNWGLSSHDDKRILSRLGRRLGFSLYMLIMLLPGVPVVYYGDEIGMENTAIKEDEIRDVFALRTCAENSRDPMRSPMQWTNGQHAGFSSADKPWLPINPNFKDINVEVEKLDSYSYLNQFKLLTKFHEEPSVLVGLLEFPIVASTIFTCLRYLVDAKCFLFILNMSLFPVCVDLTKFSQLLPNEAVLEVSSGGFPLEDDAGIVKMKSSNSLMCHCVGKSIPASSSAFGLSRNSNRVVSLKKVHLLAKEAIIFSFIGRRMLKV